jgi:hypothetical protein
MAIFVIFVRSRPAYSAKDERNNMLYLFGYKIRDHADADCGIFEKEEVFR